MRFDMPEVEVSSDTAIVVVEIIQASGDMLIIGALTDEVHEVIQIEPDQQEPAPRFGSKIDVNFIKSIGKRDGAFIIILDVDRIFSHDETVSIAEAPALAASG
jgi:purine-binding chemotaxis protein CheW